LLVVGAVFSQAEPALAHAILLASTPAAGSTIAPGAVTVTLCFNSRVDHARSRLSLLCDSGDPRPVPLAADAPPDQLVATVMLSEGAYRLLWQVLAIDGYITRGEVAFTAARP
jgi:methionine-rich copper-binding protein CopC